MTNLERWENFFKRKGWKYKKLSSIEIKSGKVEDVLFFKTYHRAMRCHMFIRENKVAFSFYKGYMTAVHDQRGLLAPGKRMHRSKSTKMTMTIRRGNLNIWLKQDNKHITNMALLGPDSLLREINNIAFQKSLTKNSKYATNPQIKIFKSKTSLNKMHGVIEFFLKLNKLKVDKVDEDTLMNACYPSLKNFPVKDCVVISSIFRERNLGFNALIKKIFGHKSKLIGKEVNKPDKNPRNIIEMGYFLKPFLNRGEMEKLVQYDGLRSGINSGIITKVRDIRKFFRNFTGQQLMHLFTQEYNPYEVSDTFRQLMEFPKMTIPEKVQNWKHVHDDITRQYRRMQQADYEFNLKPNVKKLDGIQVDNEVIVVPKTRHELIDWGTLMNNCIAGYHDQFNQGHTILLGVKEDNKIKYNIEIRDGQVRQFMANRNCRPPDEVIQKFKRVFWEHGLIPKPKMVPVQTGNPVDNWEF